MLAVVEHQQHFVGGDRACHVFAQRALAGAIGQSEAGGNRLVDGRVDRRERRQLDQRRLGTRLARPARNFERQAGLADAAGAGQGQQPRFCQQRLDLGQLTAAPDEAAQSHRQRGQAGAEVTLTEWSGRWPRRPAATRRERASASSSSALARRPMVAG